MNRFLIFIFSIAIVSSVMSQEVPQTVVFSAVVRNSDNEIIANSPIDVRLTFLEGGQYGTPVYCAVHRTTTNSMGSMTVKLNREVLSCGCNGASVMSFEDIPWVNGVYWMQVEYRTDTTGSFLLLGRIELASTIYAFVADKTLELVDVGFSADGVHDGDVLGYNEDTRQFVPVTLAHDPEVSNLAEVLAVGNSAEERSITGLSFPVDAQDAVSKSYLDSLVSAYVNIIDSLGGSLTTFTEGSSGIYRNHEYIDLGLPSGTKWATCNVGATSPEECGNHYAWGETSPKEIYHDSTYTYYGSPTEISPSNDVATVSWGAGWRMPTAGEIIELRSNCAWRWTSVNGVEGYVVRGLNGNSIFLPYYGYIFDGMIFLKDSGGRYVYNYAAYWSKTASSYSTETDTTYPYSVEFNEYEVSSGMILRESGCLVRPVYHP